MTPLEQQRDCAHKWQPIPLTCGRYACPLCAAIGRRDDRGGGITRLEPEAPHGPELLPGQTPWRRPARCDGSRRLSTPPEDPETDVPDPDSWRDP